MATTLSDSFQRIFIINLPQRRDRRVEIERELNRAGMALTPGRIEIFPGQRPSDAAGFWNTAVRGCFLSHFMIIKLAAQMRLENVLILEDDLVFSQRLLEDQAGVIEQLRNQPWSIAHLGHNEASTRESISFQPVEPGRNVTTLHLYAVNGPVLGRLADFLEQVQQRPAGHPLGGPMYPDGAISMFRAQNPDVLTLMAQPNLGYQRPSPSDLAPRWFDRAPIVKTVSKAGRAVRGWIHAATATP